MAVYHAPPLGRMCLGRHVLNMTKKITSYEADHLTRQLTGWSSVFVGQILLEIIIYLVSTQKVCVLYIVG